MHLLPDCIERIGLAPWRARIHAHCNHVNDVCLDCPLLATLPLCRPIHSDAVMPVVGHARRRYCSTSPQSENADFHSDEFDYAWLPSSLWVRSYHSG